MTLWIVGSASLPVAIPIIWAAIGTTAALAFGIYEDFGLGLSAVIVVTMLARRWSNARRLTAARS